MKTKQKIKWHKLLLIILLILCVAFIWINSFMPGDISGDISGRIEKILRFIFNDSPIITTHRVRKLAHLCEFAFLGAVFTLIFYERLLNHLPLIAFCGLFTANLDETIQAFSPGRSSQLKDVWIDFSGFMAGVIAIIILSCIIERKKRKQNNIPDNVPTK